MEEDLKGKSIEVLRASHDRNVKELKLYPAKRDRLLVHRERLQKRVDVMDKMFPTIVDGLKKIVPLVEFETKEEYWACQRELVTLDHNSNREKMVEEVENIDNQIKQLDDEIARLEKEIPRVEQQLKELEGE